MEETQRERGVFVANDHHGITNYLSGYDFEKIVAETLSDIWEILTEHSGDLASHAMIITETGMKFEPNIFTKDGIRILDSIEYISPIQKYIKNIITYVGDKVDRAAHDGTTTAMMIVCDFLHRVMGDIESRCVNTNEFRDALISMKNHYMRNIDRVKMTVESTNLFLTEEFTRQDYQTILGFIGFLQGLSSSGGDAELALAVSTAVEYTPKEALGQLEMLSAVSEQNDRFKVVREEASFTLFANPLIDNFYNKKLGTEFEVENAKVLVFPDALHPGSTKLDGFYQFITEVDDDHPVVIIAGELPGELIQLIARVNINRKNKITAFSDLNSRNSPYTQLIFAESTAIAVTAGILPFSIDNSDRITDNHLFIAKKVTYAGTYLKLYDYYEKDPNSNLHPFYLNKDKNPYYTKFLEEIIEIIEAGSKHHMNYKAMVDRAYTIKNQLMMTNVPMVYIGGTTTDNITSKLVLTDALGATIESITKGFLVSGILHVFDPIRQYPEMEETLRTVASVIYNQDYLTIYPPSPEREEGINSRLHDKPISLNTMFRIYQTASKLYKENESSKEAINYLDQNAHHYPPVQPITIYEECMKRLVEIGSKILTTNKVIVPSGAFVDTPR